ncbi:transcriptional regulator, HxlR family [Actinacidiphila yanglinensis]|uniref:Transcriptional regulator, HxlR family n=1 Tax=Actinacidiphila yanglinensis TaxID=310779 RepID=A0A1H5YTU9_9ACTN|nr:helix-turn-helix domain-containing protein [Actinacidiphila yanglinensis]SEG27699.1 transcriptional regulator, HxlR family [Actinacidiphila yanglinensis]
MRLPSSTSAASASSPVRSGELRRRLDGITQKSPTQGLRNPEGDGLVIRTVHPTIPRRGEYALTDSGRDSAALLESMRVRAEHHMADILTARQDYASRPAPEPVSG